MSLARHNILLKEFCVFLLILKVNMVSEYCYALPFGKVPPIFGKFFTTLGSVQIGEEKESDQNGQWALQKNHDIIKVSFVVLPGYFYSYCTKYCHLL